MFRYAWKAFTLELLLSLKKKATAFLDQHQGYNRKIVKNYKNVSFLYLFLQYFYPYDSAQVLEMVTSFRSVSDIIICVPQYKFSAISILVLIFNTTDFTEAWRPFSLACMSPCRLGSNQKRHQKD